MRMPGYIFAKGCHTARKGGTTMPSAYDEVMAIRGVLPADGEVTVTGADPVFSTPFKLGETAAAVLAGVGTAVNDIWELKTGRRQQVAVDARHAAAALRSTAYMQQAGPDGAFRPVGDKRHQFMLQVTRPWPTRDGKWFLPHFGLPNLQRRVLDVLGCDLTPESIGPAVAKWDALDLEAAIDEARACGAMVRTNAEWLAHPHGAVLQAKPIVEIIKLGDSAPEPLPTGDRPLSGIRALDLTRILAGPIAARTLAEHGADVLMVAAEGLPQIAEHVLDTSHGKRSTYLDLKSKDGVDRLRALARQADVFSQGYRPGIMARLGFAPEQLAELRPGIVCCSISCFGADGPFSHRAGWEQVAQTVTGICHDQDSAQPRLAPAAACDYTTGYLGAYGILLALARRAREGGSYHVRVSLCQSGMFIHRQGKVAYDAPNMDLASAEIDAIRIISEPAAGPLRHLGPIVRLSETPPRWDHPTPVLGSSEPVWLDASQAVAAE
jgi:crotonobetainyl-CoA:carnitine CoA-transferase CaiB-like acyl-CoA transferase